MKIAVIIPAAGSGERYRQAEPDRTMFSKLDEDLGGRPVLQRTVELFTKHDLVGTIIVAGPHDAARFEEFKQRHGDKLGLMGVTLCQGGKTHRYETVAAALAKVPKDATHIAVHDAARPCTPPELIDRLFGAAEKHAAVVPGVDVGDTLKRVAPGIVEDKDPDPLAAILGGGADSGPGMGRPTLRAVEATIDRERVVRIQTPQVFERSLLTRAYAQKDLSSTDDAQLVERLGERVLVLIGDPRNIKITVPADMQLARAILGVAGSQLKSAHLRF